MFAAPNAPAAHPASALPPGTRLSEFEVRDVLGVGGFGIVYLAFDHALEREVAVKEYMPASLVGRTETMHVSLRSQSDAETFALGLRSFVNEAKLLARFDHPSLVKVYRFWEANDTAYMAMPVYRGRTLKTVRAGLKSPPDEAWLRGLLLPLLGAIERLHGEGVFHRDIAPDNILIEPDGRPVLLDFGAARRVIGDKSQNLTAILKPAYAPIEQYAEVGAVRQGPWTDLYALGATLYFMLLGRPPSPATARSVYDDVQPLSVLEVPGCSPAFLRTIDWMIAPRPANRPQNVAALRDVLEGRAEPPPAPPAPALAATVNWERTQTVVTSAPTSAEVDSIELPLSHTPPDPVIQPAVQTRPPRPDVTLAPPAWSGHRSGSRLIPVLAGLALVAAGATWALWPKPAAQPTIAAAVPNKPAVAAPVAVSAPLVVAKPAPNPTVDKATERTSVATRTTPGTGPGNLPATGPAPAPAGALAARPQPQPRNDAAAALNNLRRLPLEVPVQAGETAVSSGTITLRDTPPPVHAPAPAAAVADAAPRSPSDVCGKRILLALWMCIERECGKAEMRQHAECVKWREDQASNRPQGM